jgi:hypothetical protein
LLYSAICEAQKFAICFHFEAQELLTELCCDFQKYEADAGTNVVANKIKINNKIIK